MDRRDVDFIKQNLQNALNMLADVRQILNAEACPTLPVSPSEKEDCELLVHRAILQVDSVRTYINNTFASVR